MASDLGGGTFRPEDLLGEHLRGVVVVPGHSQVGLEHVDPGARRGRGVNGGLAAGLLDVVASHRPARRHDRGVGQPQVRLHAHPGGLWVRAKAPDHPPAGGGRLLGSAGQGQCRDQLQLRLGLLGGSRQQVDRPAQRVRSRRKGTPCQRLPASVDEQPAGSAAIPRPQREIDGHLSPLAAQGGFGLGHRVETGQRQLALTRRDQPA